MTAQCVTPPARLSVPAVVPGEGGRSEMRALRGECRGAPPAYCPNRACLLGRISDEIRYYWNPAAIGASRHWEVDRRKIHNIGRIQSQLLSRSSHLLMGKPIEHEIPPDSLRYGLRGFGRRVTKIPHKRHQPDDVTRLTQSPRATAQGQSAACSRD